MNAAPRIGLTVKQAHTKKHQIDVLMARIEDLALGMRRVVGDLSVGTASVETQLEELREVSRELKTIIDRRTA